MSSMTVTMDTVDGLFRESGAVLKRAAALHRDQMDARGRTPDWRDPSERSPEVAALYEQAEAKMLQAHHLERLLRGVGS